MTTINTPADRLSRDQILDCEDEDTLLEWHDDLIDLYDSLRSHLEVRGPLRVASDDWMIRAADKASSVKTNLRRVERQLVNCGFELPPANLASLDGKPVDVAERIERARD